jgi:hypothetical protein
MLPVISMSATMHWDAGFDQRFTNTRSHSQQPYTQNAGFLFGVLSQLRYDMDQWSLNLKAFVDQGRISYRNNKTNQYFDNKASTWIAGGEFLARRQILHHLMAPYIGVGYQHRGNNGRDIHANLQHGYHTYQNMTYFPIGMQWQLFHYPSYDIKLYSEYDYIWYRGEHRLSATYAPENQSYAGKDYGIKVGLNVVMALNDSNVIKVRPYYHYYHFTNSQLTTINRSEAGIAATFSFY